jgi:CBS domain containing-hemolysin-like protein
MPKVMATQNNIRFAQDFGGVIQAVYFIFSRMSGLMVKYTNLIEKKLAQKDTGNTYSMEELDHAIELTTSPNHLDSEKKILKGIVKFGNITVRQIMKTRLDVYGVEDNITYNELLESVKEHNYSRFPVYKEDLDTIVGIIHTKDLIPHLQEEAAYAWQKLIRPVLFVHEQKMIEDLLKEFQSKRIHFAIVVDEFGGTAGIVTMEDVLEEIFGEINDEYDEQEFLEKKLSANEYLFSGRLELDYLYEKYGIDFAVDSAETLSGYLIHKHEAIPKVREVIHLSHFDAEILLVSDTRIEKVKLTIH